MKTYLYKVTPSSNARGYNRTIEVFRVKNNVPEHLGYNERINTASYKGDIATAKQLISELAGHKFSGYDFVNGSNIQVISI